MYCTHISVNIKATIYTILFIQYNTKFSILTCYQRLVSSASLCFLFSHCLHCCIHCCYRTISFSVVVATLFFCYTCNKFTEYPNRRSRNSNSPESDHYTIARASDGFRLPTPCVDLHPATLMNMCRIDKLPRQHTCPTTPHQLNTLACHITCHIISLARIDYLTQTGYFTCSSTCWPNQLVLTGSLTKLVDYLLSRCYYPVFSC